jgi:hypothetical protein
MGFEGRGKLMDYIFSREPFGDVEGNSAAEENPDIHHRLSRNGFAIRRKPSAFRSSHRAAANLRKYFNATSNSWGSGADNVTRSRVAGCVNVSSEAWSANRVMSGFSSSRPL